MANKFKAAHDFETVLTQILEDERVILSMEKMESLNLKEAFKNLFIIASYKHLDSKLLSEKVMETLLELLAQE